MGAPRRWWVLALVLLGTGSSGVAQPRPLPGLAIDGIDYDRPQPGVVHLPFSYGGFAWFGTAGGDLDGVTGTELDEGSMVGGGLEGRIGRGRLEVLGVQVEGALEGGFVAEGQALAAGSEVRQEQLVVRGWRELFRWEGFFGLSRIDVGLRMNRARQVMSNATTDLSVEQEAMIPGAELVWENRKVVGGEWGIHSRTALVMGQGDGARERGLEWRLFFNYPLFPATFQRTDVSFGYRHYAQELRFYSLGGARSTTTSFGAGGPELTVSVRF